MILSKECCHVFVWVVSYKGYCVDLLKITVSYQSGRPLHALFLHINYELDLLIL
jgi:hypothetical protein